MKFLIFYVLFCLIHEYAEVFCKVHGSVPEYIRKGNFRKSSYGLKRRAYELHATNSLDSINDVTDFIISKWSHIFESYVNPLMMDGQTIQAPGMELELSKVRITNLKTIKRFGDVQIDYSEKDQKAVIEATIQFTDVKVKANCNVLISNGDSDLTAPGNVTMSLGTLDIKLTILYNLKHLSLKVDNLALEVGEMEVDVELTEDMPEENSTMVLDVIKDTLQDEILSILGDPLHVQVYNGLDLASSFLQELMQMYAAKKA